MYWREEQDEDMRIMLTVENNTKEWLHAYNRTLPRLKVMGISILRKYYGIGNEKLANDLIMDAIANLLIKGEYDADKPKMFAYCGTAMKRNFWDMLVYPKKWIKNNVVDDNYNINDNEWLVIEQATQPNYCFDYTERQEQLNHIYSIIDTGLKECDEILIKNKKRDYYTIQGKIKEKLVLQLARQYFENNFIEGTVSALALADYIIGRCKIPDYVVSKYLHRYFNKGAQPDKIDRRSDAVDWQQRREQSYLMDDTCPNEDKVMRSRHHRTMKNGNNRYGYF